MKLSFDNKPASIRELAVNLKLHTMLLCFSLTTSDIINVLILIVYIITAGLIYLTFDQGRRQTGISLSIGQFNIFYDELKDFIDDARSIKFKSDFGNNASPNIKSNIDNSNGINYVQLFAFTSTAEIITRNKKTDDDSEWNGEINDFRHNILFPLSRYYDRLFYFINNVYTDKILLDEHKKIIFNKIERDILQTYFRVSNYSVYNNQLHYNLSTFDTEVYKSESFYIINKFFIEHNLFQYKDLKFYQMTT